VRVPIWPRIAGELLLLDVGFLGFLGAIKFGTFLTVSKKDQWRFLPDFE
jgi:hypothetical protein